MTKDEIAEQHAAYADAWAEAILDKYKTDIRRNVNLPLSYYIHDGIRRILADLKIRDINERKYPNIR